MKRVRHAVVELPGLVAIPDEIVSVIMDLAYPGARDLSLQLRRVCRLRRTCVQLCRVIDKEICALVDDSEVVLWAWLCDEAIRLFPRIQRIVLGGPLLGKKRGETIIACMTRVREVTFGCVIKEDLSIALIDKMKADVLLRGLQQVVEVTFTCEFVPFTLVEQCRQITEMKFRMVRGMSERHVTAMSNLRHLTLDRCAFVQKCNVSVFAALRNLESLYIRDDVANQNENVGYFTSKITCTMVNLRSLVLINTGVFDGFSIMAIPHLEKLYLLRTKGARLMCIFDDSIATLAHLVDVTFVNMDSLTVSCLKGSAQTLASLRVTTDRFHRFFTSFHDREEELVNFLVSSFPLLHDLQVTPDHFITNRFRQMRALSI